MDRPLLWTEEGFTLSELLLVIVILGILAGIAVPIYLGQRTKALEAEAMSNLQVLRLLEEQVYAENANYHGASANGTYVYTASSSTMQTLLPGFKPGNPSSLKFDYKIVITADTFFSATACGKTGTGVAGTKFCITQNNTMSGGSGCTDSCP